MEIHCSDGPRRVFLVNGRRTQTVNVCDANNRRGEYDWIIRLPGGTVTAAVLEPMLVGIGVDDFVKQLEGLGGRIQPQPCTEVGMAPSEGGMCVNWLGYVAEKDEWLQKARRIVEYEIDGLLDDFLKAPYLHRVEHSLHCQLFSALRDHDMLAASLTFGAEEDVTQSLHKEWPETIPREGSRRGNFDLAVLPPSLFNQFSRSEFRAGRVPAPLAIEIGLDYGWAHLAQDHEKLLNSSVPYGYLIHFERECDLDQRVVDTIESVDGQQIRACYGRVSGRDRCRKRLADLRISS